MTKKKSNSPKSVACFSVSLWKVIFIFILTCEISRESKFYPAHFEISRNLDDFIRHILLQPLVMQGIVQSTFTSI